MADTAPKTRSKAPAPVMRQVADKAPQPAGATRAGSPDLMQHAGPALGLGVQREVAVGQPGDRFEREADATADRVAQGQSVDGAAISPVTPDALAQAAPQPATPIKEEAKPQNGAEKKPETMPVQKAGITSDKKPEAMPEKKPEQAAVQKAEAAPEEHAAADQQAAQQDPGMAPDQMPVQAKSSGPGPADNIHEESTSPKGETSAEKKAAQTDAAGAGAAAGPAASSIAANAISSKGAGKPLDPRTRSTLESRLGADFSHVRVHDDTAAQDAAHGLNARAFTHGSDIWLGPGASQSDTHLMAHEATHVVQQGGGVHRMVQRANGAPTNQPAAPTGSNAGAAAPGASGAPAAPGAPGAPGGGAAAKPEFRVPQLDIPPSKFAYLSKTKDVPLGANEGRPTGADDQGVVWKGAVTPDASKIETKLINERHARGISKGKTSDPQTATKTFMLKVYNHNHYVIGTAADLVPLMRVPRWGPTQGPFMMDIDHKEEIQLGGSPSIGNLHLLNSSANRSAGGRIRAALERAIMGARADALKKGAAAGSPSAPAPATNAATPPAPSTAPQPPTPQAGAAQPAGSSPADLQKALLASADVNAVRANTQVVFDQIVPGTKDHPLANEEWEKSKVDALDPISALTPLSLEEEAALLGNDHKLVIFPLGTGGKPKDVPWDSAGKKPVTLPGKDWLKGFTPTSMTYAPGAGGTIVGDVFSNQKKGSPIVTKTGVPMPLTEIAGLEYTVNMKLDSALQAARFAEFKALSPIEFSEVGIDDQHGIVARGHVTPSIPILRQIPIDIVVEGDDVALETTFTADSFKLPGPIKVTQGAVTLRLGGGGLEATGSLGLAVERLGEGTITAKASADGLELHGTFDFDKKTFDNASLKLDYVDRVLSGSGVLGIPAGKIRGIKSATINASFAGEDFSASGTVVPDIPAVESAALSVEYKKETGLKFAGDLAIKNDTPGIAGGQVHIEALQPPSSDQYKVKGTGSAKPKIPGFDTDLVVSYDDGTFDASVTAAYNKGRLKGSVTVGATNRPVADGKPAGAAAPSAKAITVYGGGSVTVVIAPWLQGTVGVRIIPPNGEIELSGEIALPATLNIFPEKKLDKNIFTIGIDIPIVGVAVAGQRIGIFANISGGLDVSAGIGPGELQELKLGITYNPAHEEDTHVTGGAKLHVPAHAGLRLFVRGGIGAGIPVVSAEAGLELGAGLGLEGALDTGVQIDWSPATGLVLDAEASVYVEPKLKVDLSGFVKVEADLLVTTIDLYDKKWQLAGFEYGSGLRFGVAFPVHYQEGQPFNLSLDQVKFQVPDINPKAMLTDIIGRL
ncbi:MAG TPA: DUF4157 domain-containing protein [Stellaceae bacterium]|jgi:hypothetical protein|nr:DUF4157 domain-containing protein [Stellaceae bacterium]